MTSQIKDFIEYAKYTDADKPTGKLIIYKRGDAIIPLDPKNPVTLKKCCCW